MHSTWGYKNDNGPSTWKTGFPIAEGDHQSPINIETSSATCDESLTGEKQALKTSYEPEKSLLLENTGHSVKASIQQKSELTGGPLVGTHRLEQFHLHWGSDNQKGSEHTIDNKCYAAELHLVHWNSEKYSSFAEAANKPDGLAVVGLMIEAGDESKAFKLISDNLHEVQKPHTSCTVEESYNPQGLLDLPGITDYWTYQGSLTTPPLYESVRWIVLKNPIQFSNDQLEKLRSLKNDEGDSIQDNFRPPCPLCKRQVKSSFSS